MNVDWRDPATAFLTLLRCGHVFADFLFQTARQAEAKRRSVARFKRLDDRHFAEVYLVGTMTSVSVAIASGLALAP